MFSQPRDPEEHTADNDRAIEELEERNATLDNDGTALFAALEVRPEQIETLLKDRSQFSQKNWEQLQNLLRLRDEKIEREIANVPDPQKTARKRKGHVPRQDWLFVR